MQQGFQTACVGQCGFLHLDIVCTQLVGKGGVHRIGGGAGQRNLCAGVRLGIFAQRHRHNQHKSNRHGKQHRQAVQIAAEQAEFFIHCV